MKMRALPTDVDPNDELLLLAGNADEGDHESACQHDAAQLATVASSNGQAAQNGHIEAKRAAKPRKPRGPKKPPAGADSILPGERPLIVNAERVGSGETAELNPRSMANIIDQILTAAGQWPRRVGNSLFIDDPKHGLQQFAKPADLFGWIHSFAGVRWHKGPGCVLREELFCEAQRTMQPYQAIEAFPHFPPLAGHYYSHPTIVAGDGAALRGLLERFCPATPIDLDLILAMYATAAWGGTGGARTAFVIVSDYGRGVGKTTVVRLLGNLFGGIFAIGKEDRAADITKRLLTPEAATKRITLFDNVKTNRLSWAEYESLITAAEISGHRLYKGERTRPNTLLWTLTLNGPSMSRDMAQRCVVIKLGRPHHSGEWEDDAKDFVESNRWQIIADLAAFFSRPAVALEKHTRWGTWEREILARLPEPVEAQKVVAERQSEMNADDEESADVEDHFRQELERLGYDTATDAVHIPNELAREWYIRATGSPASATAVTRAIRQAHDEGMLPSVKINPCRANGRGFLWLGTMDHPVRYDIAERQQDNRWQENRHWDR